MFLTLYVLSRAVIVTMPSSPITGETSVICNEPSRLRATSTP